MENKTDNAANLLPKYIKYIKKILCAFAYVNVGYLEVISSPDNLYQISGC
jgi:hypothetical protein